MGRRHDKIRRFAKPIIHLVRHAEAEHKPSDTRGGGNHPTNMYLKDPKLTRGGAKWCRRRLASLRPNYPYITHIISSPLTRCLQTSRYLFGDVIKNGVQVTALSQLQTLETRANGIGRDLDDLKRNVRLGFADFSYLEDDWNDPEKKEERNDARKRAIFLNEFLHKLNNQHILNHGRPAEIVVVSHASVLGTLIKPLDYWGSYEYECMKTCLLVGRGECDAYEEMDRRKIAAARALYGKVNYRGSYTSTYIALDDGSNSSNNPEYDTWQTAGARATDNKFPPRGPFASTSGHGNLVSELFQHLRSLGVERKEEESKKDEGEEDESETGYEDEIREPLPLLSSYEEAAHVLRVIEC